MKWCQTHLWFYRTCLGQSLPKTPHLPRCLKTQVGMATVVNLFTTGQAISQVVQPINVDEWTFLRFPVTDDAVRYAAFKKQVASSPTSRRSTNEETQPKQEDDEDNVLLLEDAIPQKSNRRLQGSVGKVVALTPTLNLTRHTPRRSRKL